MADWTKHLTAFALETPFSHFDGLTTLGDMLEERATWRADQRCRLAANALDLEPSSTIVLLTGYRRLPWSEHPHPERALKALHALVFDRTMTEDEEAIALELEEACGRVEKGS